VLGGTTVKQLIELSGTPGREFAAAARLPGGRDADRALGGAGALDRCRGDV